MIHGKKKTKKCSTISRKVIPLLLLLTAVLSVLTTFGIVFTLIFETFTFFTKVSIIGIFYCEKMVSIFRNSGIIRNSAICIRNIKGNSYCNVVAVPIGLASAIYLSEYASDRTSRIIKADFRSFSRNPDYCLWIFCLNICHTYYYENLFLVLEIFNALVQVLSLEL